MKPSKTFVLAAGILISGLTSVSAYIYNFTTIAGQAGVAGSADGTNKAALFSYPTGLAIGDGNMYVADMSNSTIRMLTPVGTNWVTSTIAGKAGRIGSANGTNSAALFCNPVGVAVGGGSNVYVADSGNHIIRKITPEGTNWVTSTIAGKAGKAGSANGTNSAALFRNPLGVSVDGNGNVYVADSGNDIIRKITPDGTNWVVSTVAGQAGKQGSSDGTGSAARFNMPAGIALDSSGNVYVAELSGFTIRRGLAFPETFVPLQGTYNGLIMRTDAHSQASSGSLKLVLTEIGSFAAKLTMGGTRSVFGGQFDRSGNATNTVTGAKSNSWQVILHLDLTNDTEEIIGTVSNDVFQSELVADQAIFSKTNACPWAGTYTFVLMPPAGNDPDLPQGWGYGRLSVPTTGIGKLSGALGDGTQLTGTIPVSKYGTGPLYNVLYGGKGSCIGWLSFTSNAIEATVDWFKPPATAKHLYPAGFTTNVILLGSRYVAPAAGERMIDLSNTVGNVMLAFGGGNLGVVLSNSVTVATNNAVTILSGNVTNLMLKLVPKQGTFNGHFLHPVTHKSVKFQGAVLQLQDFGAGFFAGTNETGYVTFEPAE